MIKMVFCVRKKSDQSDENFYRYWLNEHGPLVASLSASLNIKRYVQSHTIQDALGQTVASGRGMKLQGFDGLAEVWWDSQDALLAALSTEEGQTSSAILAEDEARFIDLENSTIFFTEEHCVVDL